MPVIRTSSGLFEALVVETLVLLHHSPLKRGAFLLQLTLPQMGIHSSDMLTLAIRLCSHYHLLFLHLLYSDFWLHTD